ncbi:MAG: hypothetical protein SYR96_38225 [Actinomycetota bacterium]|nr:hypothetical protein [Actinomycetota bacterium]
MTVRRRLRSLAALELLNLPLAHDTRADLRRLRNHGLHRSHLARDLSRPPPV